MPEPPAGSRGRILVVEDNQANRVLAVRLLDRLGYQADVAVNGREAVEAARRGAYGAILMDCHMPVLDGYQATAEIRRLPGPAGRTPVLAMTAAVLPEERERCLAAGMDDYVAKPVSLEALAEALARWLPGRQGPGPGGDGWTERSRLLGRLLEGFLAGVPRDLAGLRAALAEGDPAALHRAAHHLKGGALTFGLDRVAAACQALELAARAGSLEEAAGLLDHLERELGAAGRQRGAAARPGSAPAVRRS